MIFYEEPYAQIYCGNSLEILKAMPVGSVQCCVTSPPYWGLRKYEGQQELTWGDKDCEHEWGDELTTYRTAYESRSRWQHVAEDSKDTYEIYERSPGTFRHNIGQGNFCQLCGAWRGAYGNEPSPEMYVDHTVEFLRSIRRVLRKDGVVFWNIGDSYASGKGSCFNPGGGETSLGKTRKEAGAHPLQRGNVSDLRQSNLKPKDLYLIPFRVALAAQADGWWVRSVIIWTKPNPMPQSVQDRPTVSHEYILLLTTSSKYYWDMEAVREPQTGNAHSRGTEASNESYQEARDSYHGFKSPQLELPAGRNLRTVWEFPTEPFPTQFIEGKKLDHFAVFPRELPQKCIMAATSEKGNCSKCQKPWVRVVKRESHSTKRETAHQPGNTPTKVDSTGWQEPTIETLGWKPSCKCGAELEPALVLDPFAGTGTVGEVAKSLGRKAILIDTSEEYCKMAQRRIEAVTLPLF